jgi:hypothetical protein
VFSFLTGGGIRPNDRINFVEGRSQQAKIVAEWPQRYCILYCFVAVDWETGEERTNASPHERGTGRTYVITNTRRLKRLQEIASHRQLDRSKLRISCLIRNKGIGWLLIEQPIRNSFKSLKLTTLSPTITSVWLTLRRWLPESPL